VGQKAQRKQTTIDRLRAARPVFLYGALLAAGTFLLSWLDYQRFARSFAGEIQIFLVATLFLALGVWAGGRLFAGRAAPAEFDGNPDVQRTLGLSAREMEVLALLADGLANKEIAARLHVSPNTVKTHVARVLEKLGARRRTEALARARELGILP
jgi:DNA-binding CsgD family transcriptional regulator